MTYIILVLTNNKIFITTLISYNLNDYKFNDFLNLYKPIRISREYHTETIDFLYSKYCRTYGIENVRCDIYPNIILSNNDIKNININISEYTKNRNKTSIYFLDTIFGLSYNSSDDESDILNDSECYNTDSD
jgi:hypothetical protein